MKDDKDINHFLNQIDYKETKDTLKSNDKNQNQSNIIKNDKYFKSK